MNPVRLERTITGKVIRTTRSHWELIAKLKHPEIDGKEEELGNGVIIKKDESGEIIGFEKINYLKKEKPDSVQSIPLEIAIV